MSPINEKRIARLRRVLFKTGWKHPFFLIPSQRLIFRIDDSIKTAAIDTRGVCIWNGAFLDSLSDEILAGVLCHEIMHALMGHFDRKGTRDHQKWNRAADRAINQSLRLSGIRLPDFALYPAINQEDLTAEQLYAAEPSDDGGGGDEQPTAGCGQDAPSGGGLPGEGEDPGQIPTPGQAARQWREALAQAKNVSVSAGKASGSALAKVLETPPSRVSWRTILRGTCARAVTAHGADDVSFKKLNRRSHSGDFMFPGPIAYTALVAVVVDTSGSVPDASLETAISEIAAISKLQPGVRFYLVTHDSEVQWQGWIQAGKRGDATARGAMRGRGGTLFAPAYEAVAGAAPLQATG